MIEKPREIPEYLMQLESLNQRIFQNHAKKEMINKRLKNEKTGFKGEQAITYPLSFLPQNDYLIFHNLRLLDQQYYFQIDTLILSPYFFLILEIKNYYGKLIFESDFDQLIRVTDDDKEEGFQNPILQVEHQKNQLKRWISRHFGLDIPVVTLVVISFSRTILKTSTSINRIKEKVCHSSNLLARIQKFKDRHTTSIVDMKQLKKVSRKLLKEHTPFTKDILKKFDIHKSEILTGVQCVNCSHIPMDRLKGRWVCPVCDHFSKDGHQAALKDYSLLIGKTITNQETKNFLGLASSSTAKRLLISMGLPYTGENKGRKYCLNFKG